MAKDTNYHHGNLRDELIEKGLRLLNRDGYDNFSLRKVASLCGVSHNAPYRHFADKDDIIKAIVMNAVGDFQRALSDAVSLNDGNPASQLREIGIRYVDFFVANPEYLSLFFNSELKGQVFVKNNTVSYDGAYLFGILVGCFAAYRAQSGGDSSGDTALILKYWSTVHGLTTLIAAGKLVFDGGYSRFVSEIMDSLVDELKRSSQV